MDIFKFRHGDTGDWYDGEIVNGLKSKMWVERYTEAGEFKLVADRNLLRVKESIPIGSLISHTKTAEVMIVENHEIVESEESDPELVISGRGFETFLENRIVGSNKTFPSSTAATDYNLVANYPYLQAILMVRDHTRVDELVDDDNALLKVLVSSSNSVFPPPVARQVKRGTVYERLLELLNVYQIGIKTRRPMQWLPLTPLSDNLEMFVHSGLDRTNYCVFSHDTGNIRSAEYLWSIKSSKNAALVSGKWIETWVDDGSVNYERRAMYIDASDIDNAYTTAPTGGDLTAVVAAMQRRGKDAIARHKTTSLAKIEIETSPSGPQYWRDSYGIFSSDTKYYSLGDIVTVIGNYGESTTMRVVEYVEIEDENGEVGHPTFVFGENLLYDYGDDVAYTTSIFTE